MFTCNRGRVIVTALVLSTATTLSAQAPRPSTTGRVPPCPRGRASVFPRRKR